MQQLHTFSHVWADILRTFLLRSYSDVMYFHVLKKSGLSGYVVLDDV